MPPMSWQQLLLTIIFCIFIAVTVESNCSEGPKIEHEGHISLHQYETGSAETEQIGDSTDDNSLFPRAIGDWFCFRSPSDLFQQQKAKRVFTELEKKYPEAYKETAWPNRMLTYSQTVNSQTGRRPYDPAALLVCMLNAARKSLTVVPAVVQLALNAAGKTLKKGASSTGEFFQDTGRKTSRFASLIGKKSKTTATSVGRFADQKSKEAGKSFKKAGGAVKDGVGEAVRGTVKGGEAVRDGVLKGGEAVKDGVLKGGEVIRGGVQGAAKTVAKVGDDAIKGAGKVGGDAIRGVGKAGEKTGEAARHVAAVPVAGGKKVAQGAKGAVKGLSKLGKKKSTTNRMVVEPTVAQTKVSIDLNILSAFIKAARPCFELFERDGQGKLVLGPGYAAAAEVIRLHPIGALTLGLTEMIVQNVDVKHDADGNARYVVDMPGMGGGLATAIFEATKLGQVARIARVATTPIRNLSKKSKG